MAAEFLLDDRPVSAEDGESILQAARRQGIEIPHLCYSDGLRPDGNCRVCVVEIEGERALAAACARRPQPGMVVRSASERARAAQRGVLRLLLEEVTDAAPEELGELERWRAFLGVEAPGSAGSAASEPDRSHPAIEVALAACIRCTRCLRACREVQVNDVIGMAGRGAASRIVFDLADPLGASSCVGCGECVQACPTGALRPAVTAEPERRVATLCPYCGVGCQLTLHVAAGRIVGVEGRDGPSNRGGRLCVKGRYGQDYARHPHRLTRPLVRRDDAPKSAAARLDPARPLEAFREASWDEALERAAAGFKRIRAAHGPDALAGFGSAKGSNEEAYLFQKLVRSGFGSNNVDHCTRLCHASSVAALLEGIGSAAVSNPVADVAHAEVILVIGANPTVNHPVAATFMKNAARCGARLIVIDPRRTELARHAYRFLQFRPDTDVALLNALLHTIVAEGLCDDDFVERRTRGFAELRAHLAAFSPEAMAPVCGIEPGTLREVARLYASSRASMIFWGMGISQHVHGTDNARCLIALALLTGQIGRRGTGLHPLRGQNNVQGASDAGLIPMVFPDYQRVDDPEARRRFEAAWGCALDPRPGLTVVEITEAARRGDIRGMYILGENPALSDPHLAHAREALGALEHLVVQDIFLTETAAFADVVLPASSFAEKCGSFTNTDRRVQLARAALAPPGEARQDLWIVQELARRLGLDWDYPDPRAVFEEMRACMPSIAGITWERLEREHAVTYPCRAEGDPGQEVLFVERFPTADGRGRLVPAHPCAEEERPDADYPLVLITGRVLEHWHTGSMTRRAAALDALEPAASLSVHPEDLQRLAVPAGGTVTVETRRGAISLAARPDPALAPGTLFLPFCYYEAAANLLTSAALDPVGKIPEFKHSAARLRAGGEPAGRDRY